MELVLQYENTFITTVDVRAKVPRARSLPARIKERPVEEAALESYVAELLASADRSFGRPKQAKVMLPSKGSTGHPDICRRPCVYFRTGQDHENHENTC